MAADELGAGKAGCERSRLQARGPDEAGGAVARELRARRGCRCGGGQAQGWMESGAHTVLGELAARRFRRCSRWANLGPNVVDVVVVVVVVAVFVVPLNGIDSFA